MPPSAPSPLGNRLLAALPPEDVTRLLPQLAPVTWALGDVLYEPARRMAYLYFPTTAVVSLIYTMLDGTTAEMGLVGQEGVVGIALFMGGDTTPNRAIVQVAGEAFRLPHIHQAKPLVMDLLPAVRVDRCWDAFSADSSDTPP